MQGASAGVGAACPGEGFFFGGFDFGFGERVPS
jgi:hypothetical protein